MKRTLYLVMKNLLSMIGSITLSFLWASTKFEVAIITLLTFIYVAILDLKD